jgi:N-acetylglucosaminyl-diphospho-decaprenol L-rhamnosyltransferase
MLGGRANADRVETPPTSASRNCARRSIQLARDVLQRLNQKGFHREQLTEPKPSRRDLVITERIADVAVLIVGFRNPTDLTACLTALSAAAVEPNFDVFICENGGVDSYQKVVQELLVAQGPCQHTGEPTLSATMNSGRFIDIQHLRFRTRPSNVWIGCATGNLGYAGGINAWLHQLQSLSGWKGIWVLNPDTEPEAFALAALVERAETGSKGMVGSTILDVERRDEVRCRGGLHWQKLAARTIAIGLGEPLNASYDLSAIETAMDSPSGASMYMTRECLEKIGPMDESYFLFFEDLDWGLRAKACGIGYASASVIAHKRGTTTGSAKSLARIPPLSVYLEHRNGIRIACKYFPWSIPVRIVGSFLYAMQFLIGRAPRNCVAAIEGVLAGLRGEIGRPTKYHEVTEGSDTQE